MDFYPGFLIEPDHENMLFHYGKDVFGPKIAECRKLEDIRKSLKNPKACGPDILYSIAMDVGQLKDREDLVRRNLLYGVVQYAAGTIGEETIRSQGHIHAISPSCNSSTPEVYEIWEGTAIIYMQEFAEDIPGRCFAVTAKVGDVVIVPPNWAHCTINGDSKKYMSFGAWCIRDYGFDYAGIRAHNGIAHFPMIKQRNQVTWQSNPAYKQSELICTSARSYPELGIRKNVPIYTQYQQNPELFAFVTHPQIAKSIWIDFEP